MTVFIFVLRFLCFLVATFCLWRLIIVDLRDRILPNIYVLGFLITGILYHLSYNFSILSPTDMALGAITGGGILLLIRTIANAVYGYDTLGLGDVKLLAAGGIWLGPYLTLIALSAGAMAGIFHGLTEAYLDYRKNGKWPDMMQLSVPAGPGFIAGIVFAACLRYLSELI